MAKEMAASAPASTTDAESTIVPERSVAAPPTVPKPPIGAAEEGRYGRSGSTSTPKVEKPSAKKINLTEFEERPKPVDIGVDPEDAVVVQPITETQEFDFKQLVMITFYVAIVLFVIAAAIYFR